MLSHPSPRKCPQCGTPSAYATADASYCSYGHLIEHLGQFDAPAEKRRFGQADDALVCELHVGDLNDKQRAVYERWVAGVSEVRP